MVTLTAAESFHCRLHYAEAVLSELFRISSVAPVTPPHRATKDTTLKGYFIPKVCIGGSVFSETCILATSNIPIITVIEMELVTATVDFTIHVTRLSARENSIEFCRCGNFKT